MGDDFIMHESIFGYMTVFREETDIMIPYAYIKEDHIEFTENYYKCRPEVQKRIKWMLVKEKLKL